MAIRLRQEILLLHRTFRRDVYRRRAGNPARRLQDAHTARRQGSIRQMADAEPARRYGSQHRLSHPFPEAGVLYPPENLLIRETTRRKHPFGRVHTKHHRHPAAAQRHQPADTRHQQLHRRHLRRPRGRYARLCQPPLPGASQHRRGRRHQRTEHLPDRHEYAGRKLLAGTALLPQKGRKTQRLRPLQSPARPSRSTGHGRKRLLGDERQRRSHSLGFRPGHHPAHQE